MGLFELEVDGQHLGDFGKFEGDFRKALVVCLGERQVDVVLDGAASDPGVPIDGAGVSEGGIEVGMEDIVLLPEDENIHDFVDIGHVSLHSADEFEPGCDCAVLGDLVLQIVVNRSQLRVEQQESLVLEVGVDFHDVVEEDIPDCLQSGPVVLAAPS